MRTTQGDLRMCFAGALCLGLLVATPRTAHAEEQHAWLTLGATMSFRLCCDQPFAFGLGPAVNFNYWLPKKGGGPLILGAYGRYELVTTGDHRPAIGGQVAVSFLGVEAGPVGTKDGITAAITPFVSAGLAWVGLRYTPGGRKDHPMSDIDFVFGAGMPLQLLDRYRIN